MAGKDPRAIFCNGKRSQRMDAPLLPSSRKQFWEAFCILLEFLVETSLLSPKAEKDTPPPLLLLLFPALLPPGVTPKSLTQALLSEDPKIRQRQFSKSGCTHNWAFHEYDIHVKVEARLRRSSQPQEVVSWISQRFSGVEQALIHSFSLQQARPRSWAAIAQWPL